MAGITGNMRTVRQLFKDDYAIGDFQRGYTWEHEHVATLVRDLGNAFERRRDSDVSGEYYLGAVVSHNRFGYHHVIDGQQRMTTLMLLLVWLRHELDGRGGRRENQLYQLVMHGEGGQQNFAIDVSEREPVMRTLFEDPEQTVQLVLNNDTDRNLVDRYMTIAECFPEELRGDKLPAFVDWLLDRVVAAKIEADMEADAYTIFETTNDRGQKLGAAQLLKNFLQSHIEDLDSRDEALTSWTRTMRELQRYGPGGDVDFVIHWLQARHAKLPTPPGEDSDVKLIAQDHFGWVKANASRLGLLRPEDHLRFMQREFDAFATMYARVRGAEEFPERGLDSLYFLSNLKIGWTSLARVVTLAGVNPEDSPQENLAKMRASATFAEIFAARLIWQNLATAALGTARNRDILEEAIMTVRHVSASEAVSRLTALAHDLPFGFKARADVGLPRNAGPRARGLTHTLLARMSACLDELMGEYWAYSRYEIRSRARGYAVAHVLPEDASGSKRVFETHGAYHKRRNRLAALLLLRAKDAASLEGQEYSAARRAFPGMSRLAQTFTEEFYTREAQAALEAADLPFKPYESFGPSEVEERQYAMVRLAELTWSADRIAFAARPNAPEVSAVYALPSVALTQAAE